MVRRSTRLDAGVELLEGLLVTKAGMRDAMGLVDGLYPGAAAAGFRNFPDSATTKAPRISEVYTRGTLTLARLGREAPIAATSPAGPALRNAIYSSGAARALYPDGRPGRPPRCRARRSSAADSPVQYEPEALRTVGGPAASTPPARGRPPGDVHHRRAE